MTDNVTTTITVTVGKRCGTTAQVFAYLQAIALRSLAVTSPAAFIHLALTAPIHRHRGRELFLPR